jgi:hypothetical protein
VHVSISTCYQLQQWGLTAARQYRCRHCSLATSMHQQHSVLAGEAPGRYVPQTVLSKDGSVLDVDLVLSEAVSDQDEVLVEYSDGPTAFRTRCVDCPASR